MRKIVKLKTNCMLMFSANDRKWQQPKFRLSCSLSFVADKNWVGDIPSANMSKILPVLFISSTSYSASCSDQFIFVPYIQERLICGIFIFEANFRGKGSYMEKCFVVKKLWYSQIKSMEQEDSVPLVSDSVAWQVNVDVNHVAAVFSLREVRWLSHWNCWLFSQGWTCLGRSCSGS